MFVCRWWKDFVCKRAMKSGVDNLSDPINEDDAEFAASAVESRSFEYNGFIFIRYIRFLKLL
jgi:hypothetical protein